MFKMIIFDLDGVLVDACEWHRLALNRALKEICGYEISLDDHHTIFNGLPTKNKLNILCDMNVTTPSDFDLINKRKQEITIKIIKEKANSRKEKIILLETLKNNGFKIACYTNSIKKTALLMLKKTGVFHLLDFLLTSEDVTKPKPNPEGYNFLVNKFNFKKDDVLIVEDSPKGKQAAYDSGCKVLEVDNVEKVNISLFKEIIK
jgi:HAD superfamily hydrolase (TIGR01509 family)